MLLVGLTGGLGAGKSTVARMLAERGAVVVDADDLARRAIEPGTPGYEQVLAGFGDRVLGEDGRLDRNALARVVFEDPEKRGDLEAIIHPAVFEALNRIVRGHAETRAIVVFDAALLMETGFDRACDVVVVVQAPVDERIARVGRSRGMSEEEASARIGAQIAPEERAQQAHVVIDNDGDMAALEARVDEVWTGLQRKLDEEGE